MWQNTFQSNDRHYDQVCGFLDLAPMAIALPMPGNGDASGARGTVRFQKLRAQVEPFSSPIVAALSLESIGSPEQVYFPTLTISYRVSVALRFPF